MVLLTTIKNIYLLVEKQVEAKAKSYNEHMLWTIARWLSRDLKGIILDRMAARLYTLLLSLITQK